MNKRALRKPGTKMSFRIIGILVVVVLILGAGGSPALAQKPVTSSQVNPTVTDTWAVKVAPGADPNALAHQMGAENLGRVGALTDYYLFRIPGSDSEATAMADVFAASSDVLWFEQQVARQQSKRVITDPSYSSQWHLADANVQAAWTAGYTGNGVTIAVVDDGLQYTHPDLSAQYVPAGSWDFNGNYTYPTVVEDSDPLPIAAKLDYHGTAAAGVAAANDDGASCGVGVAYDAGLAGLRLISDPTTDAQEASALNYALSTNSIYSNSWGPVDDGIRLEGPGPLTLAALENAVTTGRGGKGSIFVWAAGNGLQYLDNVNYDGYANSRFTIAVGAIGDDGIQSYYSEPGAAMLVTAPSSGNGANIAITTTDLAGTPGYTTGDCYSSFGGTSSAAPLVSGVVALMLQANPNLGWRDVQHILVNTAVQNDALSPWTTNGAGHLVNHKYGFGLVDAGAAVTMASTWTNVGTAYTISSGAIPVNQQIPDLESVGGLDGITSNFVVNQNIKLEHVEVVFNATHPFRGDLKVVLTAPSGVQSILAENHQDEGDNYASWKFMTVRDWDESSVGTWTLQVLDTANLDVGTFDSWELILHGTSQASANMSPNEMDFGDQMYRTSNPPKLATVTNTMGGDLHIGALQGTNPDFVISNDTCSGATVPAGQTCTFNVTYLSPELGADNGLIGVPSDDPSSPFTLYMVGNAIPGSQLLTNRSFEVDPDLDKIPSVWSRTLINPGGLDGMDTSWAFHLSNSMKVVGDGTLKHLYQIVNKSGVAGDDYQIFVVTKGLNIPNNADAYRVQIKFFNDTTVMDRRTILLKPGTYVDKRLSIPYTALADYNRIEYYLTYGKASGTAWFDLASLQWAP